MNLYNGFEYFIYINGAKKISLDEDNEKVNFERAKDLAKSLKV
jgi:hypothetical protein